MNSGTLFIFAKCPAAGKVKTRLIPLLGAKNSAKLAECFLLDILHRVSTAELGSKVQFVLCFDPPNAEVRFKKLLSENKLQGSFSLVAQSGGNLGRRLGAALNHARNCPAVFIGSDAPDLPVSEIRRAFHRAAKGCAYITHATDGGYVLLGLPAGADPKVFHNIQWSTSKTGRQQVERLRRLGVTVSESTRVWPDVDEPADLPGLKKRLERQPRNAPRTLRLLRTLL